MRKIITVTLVVFSVIIAYSQVTKDSLQVYFKVNQGKFDPLLGDNRALMDSFIKRIRVAVENDDLDHIEVFGYASPDGPTYINNRLARERCAAVVDYIRQHSDLNPSLISSIPDGIAWGELRSLVENDANIPYQKEVLDILDNSYGPKGPDGKPTYDLRKKHLMALADGIPYKWMLKNIFPKLRYAVAVSIVLKSEVRPNTASADIYFADYSTMQLSLPFSLSRPTPEIVALPADVVRKYYAPQYRMAVKTNLLYYAALMPNLELEWLFHDNWSVNLEGNLAWYKNSHEWKIYQLGVLDTEVRYRIKPRSPWNGFYIGLFGGTGWYNLNFKGNKGYYGEGVLAGLAAGYSWTAGRHILFDVEIGGGYMFTRYKEYIPHNGHQVYQRTKDLNYFGPLKAKFSIGWLFYNINRRTKNLKNFH